MIPCMQGIISWPYWVSQLFIAVPKGQQKIFVTICCYGNNFKNYLIILIIQIYTHAIPLFEGMLLYFKAKKTIFKYLSPLS